MASSFFSFQMWLNFSNCLFLSFFSDENTLILRIYFDYLYDKQIEKISKFLVDFFFKQLSQKNIIGMYIDKFAETEDFDWDNLLKRSVFSRMGSAKQNPTIDNQG